MEMDEGSKGPVPQWQLPTGHNAHHPQDQLPQHSRGFNPEQDLREDTVL